MPKSKTAFLCNECGANHTKWQGRCSECGQWNTIQETNLKKQNRPASSFGGPQSGICHLNDIEPSEQTRQASGSQELDRALGGGLVPGAVILIGGDPGIGKSTLLLQVMMYLHHTTLPSLYISGEESNEQIALRAKRLQFPSTDLPVLIETNLEHILNTLQETQPFVAVIDSIQTIWSNGLESAPGSVSQVRETAAQLTWFAKTNRTCLFLVGHVTKEGSLAGPRILEHMVDTVIYFEGETHSSFRVVRSIKNRFGAVNEIGVFAMTHTGLKGIKNPSALFLSGQKNNTPGSCVLATQEGTRHLLVEIQALVDSAQSASPNRLSIGLEASRLGMLLAILNRHCGISYQNQNVYLNAVGGIRIQEPAADLAVALAIVSSLKNKPIPNKLVVFGEMGLTGEIRPAPRGQERLKEAEKLGFKLALIPKENAPKEAFKTLEIIPVESISDAISWFDQQITSSLLGLSS